MTEWLHFHFSLSCFGEGNGNPLQCSCLENPRDGGAWWAAIYGVAQVRTRLKWLSSSSSITEDCKLLLSMYHVRCICLVKNPPAMQETWVWSLGWGDPLEESMATHSSILAWRIPWTVWSMGLQSETRLSDLHFTSLHYNTQQGVWLSNVSAYMDARFNS